MSGKAILKEIWEWIVIFGAAFILVALLNTAVFSTTQVRQTSMQDTLMEGQHLLVGKISYVFGEPSRGDIIVFLENRYPENYFDKVRIFITDVGDIFKPAERKTHVRMVKRIVGIPGDEVDIHDGKVFVNGRELEEEYVKGVTFQREQPLPIKLKESEYFVLGDNREVSKDSRTFGTVKRSQIEGKAVFRFWPLSVFGSLK
ncbi:MAG: signal peptidase I [Clostridiaceae bacterium]|jgi:signal peptidase I|nr:signal peptidase I [Clostridiaceae bacterium]